MKYQVIEISEYLINVNEYQNMEEAITCYRTWIENAKEFPQLRIKHIYMTLEHDIITEWNCKE